MAAKSTVSLKLLIDTKGKRVAYAEAGKDTVAFLFQILSLPIGTVIGLVKKQETVVGSLANLYESREQLSDSYIQPNQTKDVVSSCHVPSLALTHHQSPPSASVYFNSCNYCSLYVTDDPNACCPRCKHKMTRNMTYVAPPPDEGGFVKGLATYMVTDDLVVTPLSTAAIIDLLQKRRIKELGDLEERVVNAGMDEAVKLVHASMQTKKVLTNVFLSCKME